jgi:hypothetical protein
MSKPSPAKTTQTTEVKLPAWVDQASQSNYELAKQISNKPLTQYQGKEVADPSDMTMAGYDYLMKNVGASDPLYEAAANTYNSTLGELDTNKYLNPYLDYVEGNTVAASDRARKLSLMEGTDKAKSAGAFGGSRHGVADAVTNSEYQVNLQKTISDLRAKGYDAATATALAEKQGARDTASGFLDTAGKRQASVYTDIAGMMSAGQNDESYKQKLIDADKSKFNEARDYDTERLNVLLSALGMSPYGKTESSTKTGTSEQSGTDWASTGLGVMKALPALMGLFSDRRAKTDIEKLGKDEETGLDIYAYRYKKDPKSYPKVVGPMAQDIEKKFPGSTRDVGGHKTIPIGLLGG